MIDDTANAIILWLPKAQHAAAQTPRKQLRQGLDWLSLPILALRSCAEKFGWLTIFGLTTGL